MVRKATRLLSAHAILIGIRDAFIKLDPRMMIKNPVMFTTWVGAVLSAICVVHSLITGRLSNFELQIALWLWFTVIFANFAEALAEGRSKAQAESLKKGRAELYARQLVDDQEQKVLATSLRTDDIVVCETGDVVPADGEVIDGIASVDEISDHGRVSTRHTRKRWRSQRSNRWH